MAIPCEHVCRAKGEDINVNIYIIQTISNVTVDNDKHSCQEFMFYAYSRDWVGCHSSDLEEEVAVVLAAHSLLGWSLPHFAQRWA